MGKRVPSLRIAVVPLIALVAVACGMLEPPTLEEQGRELFTEATFDGNGRVCSTCHEPDQFGTITPEFVQARFREDPDDPLFRAIDSDDGLGASYDRLLTHATVRVKIELPTQESGLSVRKCAEPAVTTIFLNRGNPSMFNVALENELMLDGRDDDDLEQQARNAIEAHNEPAREPTPEELVAIAAFQKSLFSHAAIRELVTTGAGLELPPGNTQSEIRGREFFEPDQRCGLCHSGPMLNQTSELHPLVVGSRFEGVAVGDIEDEELNERVYWCYVDAETNRVVPGPSGDTLVFPGPVADPGLMIVPGSTSFTQPDGTVIVMEHERLGPIVGGALFKIPTLWGAANTAPYFHDNSAKTLEEVLEHYNRFFSILPPEFVAPFGCEPGDKECLSEQDRTDIIAYLELLAFERE